MTEVAIVYHSGYGHTKLQAEAVAAGAGSVDGVTVRMLTAEEGIEQLESLASADAIVFGSPTYMGSVSGPMMQFMDATSKAWFAGAWKDKIAGGFTNSGSPAGDKMNTRVQCAVLAAQQGMVWGSLGMNNELYDPNYSGAPEDAVNRAGFYLGAGAQSANSEANEANPPAGDIKTARLYGVRIAEAAKRWNGR